MVLYCTLDCVFAISVFTFSSSHDTQAVLQMQSQNKSKNKSLSPDFNTGKQLTVTQNIVFCNKANVQLKQVN